MAGSFKGKYQTNHCLSRSRRNSWFHRQALLTVRLWTKYTFEQNGQLQWRTIMNNGISTWRTKMGWMAVCQVRWLLHGYKNNEYWASAFNNQEKTAYEIIPNILVDHWFLWWDQSYGPLEWLSVLQLKNLYQEAAAFLKPENAVELKEKQQIFLCEKIAYNSVWQSTPKYFCGTQVRRFASSLSMGNTFPVYNSR